MNFKLVLNTPNNPYLRAEHEYFGATLEITTWYRSHYNHSYWLKTPDQIRPHFNINTVRGQYHDRDKRKFSIEYYMDPEDPSRDNRGGLYYPVKPSGPGEYHNPWHGPKIRANSKLAEAVDRDITLLIHGVIDDVKEPLFRAIKASEIQQRIKDAEHRLWALPRQLHAIQVQMDNRPLHELQIMDWEAEITRLIRE